MLRQCSSGGNALGYASNYSRKGGVSDFKMLCEAIIIVEYAEDGANIKSVLTKWCLNYRLWCEKVDDIGARKAVIERRPVIGTFWLSGQKWDAFEQFYKQTPKGVLTKEDICINVQNKKSGPDGHAVVLVKVDPDCLTFMNAGN